MACLLEVLPCSGLNDAEMMEVFGASCLQSKTASKSAEQESDSGMESLEDLAQPSIISEDVSPYQSGSSRSSFSISADEDLAENVPAATAHVSAPPSVPPPVPFRPPLHRWVSREKISPPEAPTDVRVLIANSAEPEIDTVAAVADSILGASVCCVCYCNTAPLASTCCGARVCMECKYQIIVVSVNDGVTSIQCPGTDCDQSLWHDEIVALLEANQDLGTKDKYERFRLAKSSTDYEKVCPQCSWLTAIASNKKPRRWKKSDYQITCEKCSLEWCFKCHAPWHQDLSCRQFKHGNKDFKKWIGGRNDKGIANGHHCPSCSIPIQRST